MIELKVGNNELAITQEDDVLRVEIPASGINPVGAIKPAVPDSLGIGPTLRFDSGTDSIAGVGMALPDKTDRSQTVTCRIGWGATTTTGDVKWSLLYKWIETGTALNGAEDGTLITVSEVDTVTTTGYVFTSFTIPAPGSTDRVLALQIERTGSDGVLDTCAGAAHLIGLLCDFTAGVTP